MTNRLLVIASRTLVHENEYGSDESPSTTMRICRAYHSHTGNAQTFQHASKQTVSVEAYKSHITDQPLVVFGSIMSQPPNHHSPCRSQISPEKMHPEKSTRDSGNGSPHMRTSSGSFHPRAAQANVFVPGKAYHLIRWNAPLTVSKVTRNRPRRMQTRRRPQRE